MIEDKLIIDEFIDVIPSGIKVKHLLIKGDNLITEIPDDLECKIFTNRWKKNICYVRILNIS